MPMMIPMKRPVRIARIMITKSLTSVVNVKDGDQVQAQVAFNRQGKTAPNEIALPGQDTTGDEDQHHTDPDDPTPWRFG